MSLEMDAEFRVILREWRMSRGLFQKEAADILGVNKRTYEAWEYGRTCPKGLAIAELKRRMSVSEEPQSHPKSSPCGTAHQCSAASAPPS